MSSLAAFHTGFSTPYEVYLEKELADARREIERMKRQMDRDGVPLPLTTLEPYPVDEVKNVAPDWAMELRVRGSMSYRVDPSMDAYHVMLRGYPDDSAGFLESSYWVGGVELWSTRDVTGLMSRLHEKAVRHLAGLFERERS